MRAETFAKGFVVSVILLFVVGCAPTSPEFPLGEFVDAEGNVITYKADGRVTFSSPEFAGEQISGEYSVDGDTITSSGGGGFARQAKESTSGPSMVTNWSLS